MNNQKEVDALKKELKELLNSKLNYADVNKLHMVIEKLNELEPEERIMDKEEAWDVFKNNYLLRNENFNTKKTSHTKRKLSVALIALIIFVCISIVSAVANINIFEPFIKWTKDVMNINSNSDNIISENDTKKFESIPLLENYVGEDIPELNYLPENFKINQISLLNDTIIKIIYSNNEEQIKYIIYPVGYDYDLSLEKTENEVVHKYVNNIDFMLFNNINWSVIEWKNENFIHYVIGTFSYEESLKIIENIK